MSDDRRPLPPALMSGLPSPPSLLSLADPGPARERVRRSWEVIYLRFENIEFRNVQLENRVAEVERQLAEISAELRKT